MHARALVAMAALCGSAHALVGGALGRPRSLLARLAVPGDADGPVVVSSAVEAFHYSPQLTVGKYLTMRSKRVGVSIVHTDTPELCGMATLAARALKRAYPDVMVSATTLEVSFGDATPTPTPPPSRSASPARTNLKC